MNKKIDIGQKAKVRLVWNVNQGDYTKEEEKSMIALMAKKYGIPSKNIKVEVNYTNTTEDGVITLDSAKSIHDPVYMQELMKKWMADNHIEGVDFGDIVKIDSQINSLIDFDSYDKGKKYSIKWVKWSNFLSYGPDNFFDFTNLHGLVLLNGEPANKSGKSTFAYDLLHFLLFGKPNPKKAKTLGGLFNNYTPDVKTLNVEGCINIDGEDYIIRRTLTRNDKGKATSKVEYYKVMDNGEEELLVDENQQGASTTETNKIIKEALGSESDFDLIISANAKDLDDIITMGETEKGRLLSRWIGLSVIEDKDTKAREKWNKEISVGRFCDMYNKAQLETDIETFTEAIEEGKKEIEANKARIDECDKKIETFNTSRDALLSAKQEIKEDLLKVDAATLTSSIERITENGRKMKSDLELTEAEIRSIGDVEYSDEEYNTLKRENEKLIGDMGETRVEIKNLRSSNEILAKAEYCPTCHRKYENVDNSALIAENEKKIEAMTQNGIVMKKRSDEIGKLMATIDEKRALCSKKAKLQIKVATISAEIASQRVEYKEKKALLEEIKRNMDAIAKNSEIDANLNVLNANIRNENTLKSTANSEIGRIERENAKNTEQIALRKSYLVKIDNEKKTEKNWKLYLQMIGKDGISKMVLRNALPIMNNELRKLLDDVTDFNVEIRMNEKNDIDFVLIRDDVETRLSAASGLESTQAALALRVVLGKMSRLSMPPFIFLDEVLGTVAKENYDSMRLLYERITEYYDFVLHITHLADIVDWHDSIITVQKIDNISSVKYTA